MKWSHNERVLAIAYVGALPLSFLLVIGAMTFQSVFLSIVIALVTIAGYLTLFVRALK